MPNALLYAPAGGGKTVNSTRVLAPKRGKNLLICTDNSSIVLRNFDRKNLTIAEVHSVDEFLQAYHKACDSKQYDNIILDNLSDLFDMWILELGTPEEQQKGAPKDIRQQYQLVYQELKRLTRKSTAVDCNTIFTAWTDMMEIPQPDGSRIQRLQPKLPYKILDNVCGLMNVIGYVATDGQKWWYVTKPTATLFAKDQIFCRDYCLPETIFEGEENKK